VAGCCEHVNESSGSVKRLAEYLLASEEAFAPWGLVIQSFTGNRALVFESSELSAIKTVVAAYLEFRRRILVPGSIPSRNGPDNE